VAYSVKNNAAREVDPVDLRTISSYRS